MTLRVPEHWPMAWWSADQSTIRLACPSCGAFSLYMHRHEDGGLRSLACDACGLSGLSVVQRAFDALPAVQAKARAQDEQAHDTALREGSPHLSMTKEKLKLKKAA